MNHIDDLNKLVSLLNELHKEYWLDHGTLLGFYREKKVIEWDGDMDIGMIYESETKCRELFNIISKQFKMVFIIIRYYSVNIIIYDQSQMKIDIAFYFPQEGNMIKTFLNDGKAKKINKLIKNAITWPNLKKPPLPKKQNSSKKLTIKEIIMKIAIRTLSFCIIVMPKRIQKKISLILFKSYPRIELVIPEHYFRNLQELNIDGYGYLIPDKIEEYLEFRYGKDWKIPKKDWNFLKDDGAINKE